MRWCNGLTKNRGRLVNLGTADVGLLVVGALATASVFAAPAGASATKLCVPKAAGKPVKTPTRKGRCPRKYKLVELGREGKPGPQGKEGARGERGESGGAAVVEAVQFSVQGGGLFTGGQVVSVPAGSYGPEPVSPENTISYGPFSTHGVVAEIHVAGKESLGEATADVHASNLAGTQVVGGVTGRVILKGKFVLLELTHIGFQVGADLSLKEGKLVSEKGETYWVKVGISLRPR
jgi:hypothetical protein